MVIGIAGDRLNIREKVSVLTLKISATAIAVDGDLEFNMRVSPDLLGMGRKKAADLIMQKAAPYPSLKVWKAPNGNLRLSVTGMKFVSSEISEGIWRVEIA
jgi:hypothetical protein